MNRADVAWGRVVLFYGLALGTVCLVVGATRALGGDPQQNTWLHLGLAGLYMLGPLLAGLTVESVAGRRRLISSWRVGLNRRLPRACGLALAFWLLYLLLETVLTGVLGNLLGLPGVGRLPFSPREILPLAGGLLSPQQLPSWPWMGLGVSLLGLGAGCTVNAIFAFAEEYGWRGVLQDELAPLGASRANLLIGLMWGLWHAPMILWTGYLYPAYPKLGILLMTVALVPFSALLYQARRLTGTLLGPSLIHGLANSLEGLALSLPDRHSLVAYPLGLLGILTLALLAWLAGRIRLEPLPLPGSSAYPQDRDGP